MLKITDIILTFSVLLVALVILFVPKNTGNTVTVKQNNEVVYTAPLSENKVLVLKGNTVVIENGIVYMKSADCKNQLCIHQGKISKSGGSIICLPNRVIIEITK